MRLLPDGFQAHLDSGATTLCWCWKVVRQDEVVFGFTDHDRDLNFDGTTFEAGSGFAASDTRQSVGLNVDNSDVDGALQSDRITQTDLANGLYDNARVELFRVNWSNVEQRVLMRVASIGEVTSFEHGFRAELRGLAHVLGQQQGRVYQRTCDADLGDGRCGFDLSAAQYTSSGSVTDIMSPSQVVSSDLGEILSGWFAFGLLHWVSGANLGKAVQVKGHRTVDGMHVLQLWESMRGEIVPGDNFTVTAGCDKHLSTCANKFSNAVNFRGFPHLPGPAYVTLYPNSDDPR